MDLENAKVLDSGRKVVVQLKRKQTGIFETYAADARCTLLSSPNFPTDKPSKQRKLDGVEKKCEQFGHFLRYYSNFMKSGIPQRILFYKNGNWVDFTQDILSSVRKSFQVKNAAVEVEVNGDSILLDFLHMMGVNLNTGLQNPVAWIDEAGSCFFPESYSYNVGDCSAHDCNEIRLQLEIDLNGIDFSKLKECSGESNDIIKEAVQKSVDRQYDADVDDSFNNASDPKVDLATADKQFIGEDSFSRLVPVGGILDSDSIQNLFFAAMGSHTDYDILNIHHVSSSSMQARLGLFQKQVEITQNYRGNANVQYAWLSCSKEALFRITNYGLGLAEMTDKKFTYGIGVHLMATNSCGISAIGDIDENGEQHVFLCRVVLGNTEIVFPGSKQCHPSCADYDSGVDDLQNPRHYVVWHMNMNTCIYPEFAVSFKVSSISEGCGAPEEGKHDVSGVTTSPGLACHLRNCPYPADAGSDCNSKICVRENLTLEGARIPKSPWLPFPVLLSEISEKVPVEVMEHVHLDYGLFRSKKIERGVFIKKLRHAVGDTLLRSIITSLQRKVPPPVPNSII